MSAAEKINFKDLLQQYKNVIFFVQKSNDLDTCAGALAMAKLFKNSFPDKPILIANWHTRSKFLRLLEEFKYTKNKREEGKTLAILIDINSPKQLIIETNKENLKLLEGCDDILQIDHHADDESDDFLLLKDEKHLKIKKIVDSSYCSCCGLIWDMLKNDWKISPEIATMLFLGVYGDNQEFLSSGTNPKTFRIVSELYEHGVDVVNMMRQLKERDMNQLLYLANIWTTAQRVKNLIVLNAHPLTAQKFFPHLFYRNKSKVIRQRKLLTYPITITKSLLKVNTLVYIHYSLFDPFDSDKRYIFIVLEKQNLEIEATLKAHGFKKNRNRWSRSMSLKEIGDFLDKYQSLLSE